MKPLTLLGLLVLLASPLFCGAIILDFQVTATSSADAIDHWVMPFAPITFPERVLFYPEDLLYYDQFTPAWTFKAEPSDNLLTPTMVYVGPNPGVALFENAASPGQTTIQFSRSRGPEHPVELEGLTFNGVYDLIGDPGAMSTDGWLAYFKAMQAASVSWSYMNYSWSERDQPMRYIEYDGTASLVSVSMSAPVPAGVPEPATWVLAALGTLCFGVYRRSTRSK
jgi:hypothetical protein